MQRLTSNLLEGFSHRNVAAFFYYLFEHLKKMKFAGNLMENLVQCLVHLFFSNAANQVKPFSVIIKWNKCEKRARFFCHSLLHGILDFWCILTQFSGYEQ